MIDKFIDWGRLSPDDCGGDLLKAVTTISKRKERERIAKELRVIKAAEKAGLKVTRASVVRRGASIRRGGGRWQRTGPMAPETSRSW
jgi:hypothetical protein